MTGWSYLTLAALILLLLPAVIMPWEGRRVPDGYYALIAAAGLAAAGGEGGIGAIAGAVAGAIAVLCIVTAIVASIRAKQRLQLLTSGDIKLLSAGSLWLGPVGALIMVAAAFALLFAAGILQHRRLQARRPDFAAMAAFAILCVSTQQSLIGRAENPAMTAEPSR
jgi:prepilin signal peptidase PulO-like enzyme (type II secretory pathway)